MLHGILQTRIRGLEAIPFSRGSSQPRDWTQVSRIADRFFTIWATREAPQRCSIIPELQDVTKFYEKKFFFFFSQNSKCVCRNKIRNIGENCFCFFSFRRPAACGALVPRPGMKPVPSVVEHGVLTTGLPQKSWRRLLFEFGSLIGI